MDSQIPNNRLNGFGRLPFLVIATAIAIVAVGVSTNSAERAEAQTSGICDRTFAVQSAILGSSDAEVCEDVTSAHLASIDFLDVSSSTALSSGDLDGLAGLEFLGLQISGVIPFPEGLFDDLVRLDTFYVRDATAVTIAENTFQGLTQLESLIFSGLEVSTIESGAFNGLFGLERLYLYVDKVTAINGDTFDGLADPMSSPPASPLLETLRIAGVEIDSIAVDTFADLSNLDTLRVETDALTDIPVGMFNGLGKLTWLILRSDSVTTVTPGAFSGVGQDVDDEARDEDEDYGVIYLVLDAVTTLQPNTFSGLDKLDRLAIAGDVLSTLEEDVFVGLDSLEVLYISGGEIMTVPSGIFDDLPADLSTLRLNRGGKEIMESGALSESLGVEAIDVWDESLMTLKAGYVSGINNLMRLYFDDAGNINSVEQGAFADLPLLQILDLSNNKISSLPDDIFQGLTMLEKLDLGDNPLIGLPAGFVASPPCGLETLDISGDGFTGIPSAVVDGVTVNILSTLPQPDVNGCGPDHGVKHLILDGVPMTQADLDLLEPYKVLESLSMASTGVTAEQVFNIRRTQEEVTFKSLDISHNDLSAVNEPAARAAFGAIIARLVNLEELHLAGTGIDGETALAILQNVNPNIVELSFADNNLADWNHPDLAQDLTVAWDRLWRNWDLIDLSNTAIDSQAAGAIVPYIERTQEGVAERVIAELDQPGIDASVTLVLSNNYLTRFGSGWLSNWEFVNVIDLSCNEISTVEPEWFLPVSEHLEILTLRGNPLETDEDDFEAVLPNTDLRHGEFDQCTARFALQVDESEVVPVNPSGQIPTILTGTDGTTYEVFTPVEGGEYSGESFSLEAPAGAVPNGEFVGVSISKGEPASNVGQTHHRYSLSGDWYRVGVVDGDGQAITDYQFNAPAQACLPLPPALRDNVDDVVIVAMRSTDEGFTVLTSRLSSRVRLSEDGSTQVCGSVSAFPANLATAKFGAPSALPEPDDTQSDTDALPATGGFAMPIGAMIALLMLAGAVAAFGLRHTIRQVNPRR